MGMRRWRFAMSFWQNLMLRIAEAVTGSKVSPAQNPEINGSFDAGQDIQLRYVNIWT